VLEKGIDCQREHVPFDLTRLYEPRHPEVSRINPKQQVPVLVDGDLEIFDSTQIFEYLEDVAPEPPLWPRDPRQRARARLLELRSDEVFFPHVITLMPQRSQAGSEERQAAKRALQDGHREMERQLDGRAYLAGDYSYADIAFFMAQTFAHFLGAPWAQGHPRLDAWRDRVGGRPAVRRVVEPMAAYLRDAVAAAAPVPAAPSTPSTGQAAS
jgi:glutathione S-transferase